MKKRACCSIRLILGVSVSHALLVCEFQATHPMYWWFTLTNTTLQGWTNNFWLWLCDGLRNYSCTTVHKIKLLGGAHYFMQILIRLENWNTGIALYQVTQILQYYRTKTESALLNKIKNLRPILSERKRKFSSMFLVYSWFFCLFFDPFRFRSYFCLAWIGP